MKLEIKHENKLRCGKPTVEWVWVGDFQLKFLEDAFRVGVGRAEFLKVWKDRGDLHRALRFYKT